MIDSRTQHRGYPLPHDENFLQEDLPRIQDAIVLIDADIARIEALLQSDDVDLDTLQELVNALKTDQAGLAAVMSSLAGKADQAAVDALAVQKADATALADAFAVNFALLNALM